MTSDETFDVPAGVAARRVGNETVILDLGSGHYYSLNEVGTRIWELVAEGRSLDAVCAALVEEFDADRALIDADATSLIEDLVANGLLSRT